MIVKEGHFSVASNVITDILGSNLTENYSIVFAEQIKNAKDSKATEVVIDFSNFPSTIIISDNGSGILPEDIEHTWLRAGTLNKADNPELLGGKGIGRFTLFSLGNSISIETISNYKKSSFTLEKSFLSSLNSLENTQIKIATETQSIKQGTTITITETIPEILDLTIIKKDLANLLLENKEFNIKIIPNNSQRLPSLMSFDDAIKFASSKTVFNLSWNADNYTFTRNAIARIYDKEDLLPCNNIAKTKVEHFIDSNKEILSKIGNLSFTLYSFYRPQYTPSPYKGRDESNSTISNQFLNYASGINIYRNNFKLFGYGSNDWLSLDNTARNRSDKTSNSRSVGQITLSKESSNLLVEKSSREGLLTSNKSFEIFKKFILLCIDEINSERINLKEILNSLGNTTAQSSNSTTTKASENSDINDTSNTPKTAKGSDIDDTKTFKISATNNPPSNTENSTPKSTVIHSQIIIKPVKVPQKTCTTINLYDYIDFKESISEIGTAFKEEQLIFFENNSTEIKNGYITKDVAQDVNIVVKSRNDSQVSNQFQISVVDNKKRTNRTELFPINPSLKKHFRLESDNSNDYTYIIMTQINELWITGEYDFLISATLRSITDMELSDRLKYQNDLHQDSPYYINNLGNNFSAVSTLVNYVTSNKRNRKNLRTKMANKLGISSKDDIKNFFSQLNSNPDVSFEDALKVGHVGAHRPNQLDPDRIISLAKNTILFLELCESFIKVLEEDVENNE